MRTYFTPPFVLFSLICIFASPVHGLNLSVTEQHQYLRTTGSRQLYFDWQLKRGDDLKLVTVLGDEEDTTSMRPDLATYSWKVDDPVAGTDISIVRDNNQLLVSGTFKNKTIRKSFKIDSEPWYQALSLSLRQFADTPLEHLVFWSIRPDTLELHRLQVTRVADELLKLKEIENETIKLKIQLTGLKAPFWSCYYWLRKSDGLFLRYEGPSGPPGWPLTTVELIDPTSQVRVDHGPAKQLTQ